MRQEQQVRQNFAVGSWPCPHWPSLLKCYWIWHEEKCRFTKCIDKISNYASVEVVFISFEVTPLETQSLRLIHRLKDVEV